MLNLIDPTPVPITAVVKAMTPTIDLGQVLISFLIGAVGWLIKREIMRFGTRLDQHEKALSEMIGAVSRVTGEVSVLVKLFNPHGRQ